MMSVFRTLPTLSLLRHLMALLVLLTCKTHLFVSTLEKGSLVALSSLAPTLTISIVSMKI